MVTGGLDHGLSLCPPKRPSRRTGRRRCRILVPSSSDAGMDAGGCSAGRATACCACWPTRIGLPASTRRLPFAGGRAASADGASGQRICHLLTSPRSAYGADSPAFVCDQVTAVGLPFPRLWRYAGHASSSRMSPALVSARACRDRVATVRMAPRSRDGSPGGSYVHRSADRVERATPGHRASASGSASEISVRGWQWPYDRSDRPRR